MFSASYKAAFPRPHKQLGSAGRNVIAAIFIVSGLLIMAWAMFPPTFSTDLDRIGQGKPAIALVYDLEDGASTNLMEGYTAIRDEFDHLVEFLVVDVASPKGEAFRDSRQAAIGSALYYSASGEKVMVLHGPQENSVLLDSIKNAFGL